MRRKLFISIMAVAMVVLALSVGLAIARAQTEAPLPPLTAQQLLSTIGEKAGQNEAVSGEYSWSNKVVDPALLQMLSGGSFGAEPDNGTPGLAALMQGGTGRLWIQDDGVRVEAQGPDGEIMAVTDGSGLWVYESGTDSATHYSLSPEALAAMKARHEGALPEGDTASASPLDLPARVEGFIDELAPTAALSVTGDASVAGRRAYLLTMTPATPGTAVDRIEVAVDGKTFVPLRVEVFAKTATDAVLSAGFTSVSYDPVDPALFTFMPSAGTTVTKETVSAPSHPMTPPDRMTFAEAQDKAGFALVAPQDQEQGFHGAYVIPAAEGRGPVAITAYGQGFDTVLVVQTRLDGAMDEGLGALGSMPMLQAAGGQPFPIDLALGSARVWADGERMVLAAGMLTPAVLDDFVAGLD